MKTAGRLAVQQTDDDTCEMRISSAQRSDTGLYVCKILNEYGSEQAECRVEVKGEQPSTELVRFHHVGTNISCCSFSAGRGANDSEDRQAGRGCGGEGGRVGHVGVSHRRTSGRRRGLAVQREADPARAAQLQNAL